MNVRQVIFAGTLLLLPCFAARALACQCRERQPPCSQYAEADAVFVGSVTDSTPVDENLSPLEGSSHRKIGFSVERAFHGVEGARAELIEWGTSCDFGFADGKTYLVYAYRSRGEEVLSTSYCSRTRELSEASADLTYLDGLKSAAPQTLITGLLADRERRLKGVRVTAEGGGGLYRSASDREGWFRLAVPKPGRYTVRIFLPPDVAVAGPSDLLDRVASTMRTRRHYVVLYDVEVRAGGCSFLDVPLFLPPRGERRARGGV
ncbi:MAG TPA: hypothetical protein VJ866_01505 [Pyrinomonadaceae bacterium]|nr:hypothetical protein [Pyrinomonadaceae bacterium]